MNMIFTKTNDEFIDIC